MFATGEPKFPHKEKKICCTFHLGQVFIRFLQLLLIFPEVCFYTFRRHVRFFFHQLISQPAINFGKKQKLLECFSVACQAARPAELVYHLVCFVCQETMAVNFGFRKNCVGSEVACMKIASQPFLAFFDPTFRPTFWPQQVQIWDSLNRILKTSYTITNFVTLRLANQLSKNLKNNRFLLFLTQNCRHLSPNFSYFDLQCPLKYFFNH